MTPLETTLLAPLISQSSSGGRIQILFPCRHPLEASGRVPRLFLHFKAPSHLGQVPGSEASSEASQNSPLTERGPGTPQAGPSPVKCLRGSAARRAPQIGAPQIGAPHLPPGTHNVVSPPSAAGLLGLVHHLTFGADAPGSHHSEARSSPGSFAPNAGQTSALALSSRGPRHTMIADTVSNSQRSFVFSCAILTTLLAAACWGQKARD